MKRSLLVLAIFSALIGPQLSCAQTPEIDSLLTVIREAKEDTHKVNALNLLSERIGRPEGQYDTAFYYAENARSLAEKLNFKKGIADSYNNIGVIQYYLCNYTEALNDQFTALKIFEEIGDKARIANSYSNIGRIYAFQDNYTEALKNQSASLKLYEELEDRSGIATVYNGIGLIYQYQGNYPEALKNYTISLSIREELGDKPGIALSYNNIGIIYYYLGNYTEALKNHFVSLKIKEEIQDKYGIAGSYSNIGNIYRLQGNYTEALKKHFASLNISEEIGDKDGMANSYNNIAGVYHGQDNHPEALKFSLASLKIREEIGDKSGIAISYTNIGDIYQKQNNYPEALKMLFASLDLFEEIGNIYGIASCCNSIGTIYLALNDKDTARNYLLRGLRLSKEIGAKDLIQYNYQSFSILDSAQGDYKSAFNNYKLFILYRDSLLNEENTKKTTQLEMQYEFDKKEALAKAEQEEKDALALKELQKQKLVRNGFVGGFVVMVLFSGVFFTQRNKIKKGKKQSDELLLNILPEEVAEELKLNGHADAQHFDQVTVLFTDFKGFTAMAEQLSAKELVEDLNICFSEFDRICGKYGIEKIKTIGDAYMAAGGLPIPNSTHAKDVVNAALEMADVVARGKAKKIAEGLPFFEIRIGVHTGPVVAGIVGIKKFQYDIWGDTVNTASRMESSGEVGKVNISETTYQLVKDRFACVHRGKVQAKGKGGIDMYFVSEL